MLQWHAAVLKISVAVLQGSVAMLQGVQQCYKGVQLCYKGVQLWLMQHLQQCHVSAVFHVGSCFNGAASVYTSAACFKVMTIQGLWGL